MKKLWDLNKVLSNLEAEEQGRGIIMGVTRLLLLGPFMYWNQQTADYSTHHCTVERRRTFVRMLRSANTHSRVHSRASQMAILWCLQKPLWDVLKVIYMPLCAINFQRLHACIYAFFIPLMCLSVQGYTTLVSLSLLLSLVKIFLKSDLNFWQQAWCVLFSQNLSIKDYSILVSYFTHMGLDVNGSIFCTKKWFWRK